jgi:hypothetical protein
LIISAALYGLLFFGLDVYSKRRRINVKNQDFIYCKDNHKKKSINEESETGSLLHSSSEEDFVLERQ